MAQLDRHLALHGPLPSATALPGDALVELAERAKLRGAVGPRFPRGHQDARSASSRGRAIVVANGCESEPMSAKDALLLRELPHLVLDGAALAARAVGADAVSSSPSRDRTRTREPSLEHALKQRRAERSRRDADRALRGGRGAFLTGQETSLVSQINGGQPRPTFIPPRPTDRGVRPSPHARTERRDARAPRADRPLRGRVVRRRGNRRRARLDARDTCSARSTRRVCTRSSAAPRWSRCSQPPAA
jgi:hypothetical protein